MSERIPPNDDVDEAMADFLSDKKTMTLEVYGNEDDSFVTKVGELVKQFHIEPQRVLYPGSNAHAGVARIFGKDKVTHVDPDSAAMATMAAQGYQAVTSGIEDYTPDEPFDVIVSFNAGTLEPAEIQRLLSPTGYVIANNWHGSANRMAEYDDFRLVGAVLPSYEKGTIINGERAAAGLGTTRLGIGPKGEIAQGDEIDESTMIVTVNERSPDGLFLFQREQPTL